MKNEDKFPNKADDHLIDILKKIDLQEPSDQFVDQVMNAYAQQKSRKNFRSLKTPFFLMGSIGLLLFLPWLMSLAEIISDNPQPKLLDFIQDLSLNFSVWYFVCPIVLLLSLASVVLIEMKSITFHKTNASIL